MVRGRGELPELAAVPAAVWEAAQAPIAPVPSLALVPLIVAEVAPAAEVVPTAAELPPAAAPLIEVAEVAGDGLAVLELVAAVEPVAVEKPSPNPSEKPSGKPSRNLLGSLPRSLLSDGAVAPLLLVRVLHERDVPEGRLFVLASEARARPRVIVVGPGASLRQPVRGAWWVRMYRLRPFTPAELEVADPQTTIPLVAAGRAPWARRLRPPLVPPTPATAAPAGALGGAVANDQRPAAPLALDPRAELAAMLRSELPADLDPDIAAVMLGALARRTPQGW
jgi:hypothetical protein